MSTRKTNNDRSNFGRTRDTRGNQRDKGGTLIGTTIAFVAEAASNGAELVTNGTFATDTAGWTAVRNATLSVATGYMRIARNGTNNPAAEQTITGLIAGRTYLFSYDVLEATAGGGSGTISDAVGGGTLATAAYVADGSPSTTFVAPTSGSITVQMQASTSNATDYSDFDNVSVKEVVAAITDSGNGLAIFGAGQRIAVLGSPANSRTFEVATSAAGTLRLRHADVVAEAAGASITLYSPE